MTRVHVGAQTFNVPCRRFAIRLTVSKSERLPLVKEFALRIIYILGECDPEYVKAFFGFSDREMAILLQDLEEGGLIYFSNERVNLTEDARVQFEITEDGSAHVHVVENWSERFAIDFISFSLIHFVRRNDNFRVFHDLYSPDHEKVSRSRAIAKEMFVDSFYEYVEVYKSNVTPEERSQLSVYGISGIEAGDKFTFPLTAELFVDPASPNRIHHEYAVFKSEAAQDRRRRLIQEVARKVALLGAESKCGSSPQWIFRDRLDDRFFSMFCSGNEFAVSDLLARFAEQQEIRYDDDQTIAIVGPFEESNNIERMLSLMKSALDSNRDHAASEKPTSKLFWGKPSNQFWGRTEQTYNFLSRVRSEATKAVGRKSEVHLVINSNYENAEELRRRLTRRNNHNVFDRGLSVALRSEMEPVEVLIWPGVMAGLLYHYSGGAHYEYPIPIGFITTCQERVSALSDLLLLQWTGHGRKVRLSWSKDGHQGGDSELSGYDVFSEMRLSSTVKSRSRKRLTLRRNERD